MYRQGEVRQLRLFYKKNLCNTGTQNVETYILKGFKTTASSFFAIFLTVSETKTPKSYYVFILFIYQSLAVRNHIQFVVFGTSICKLLEKSKYYYIKYQLYLIQYLDIVLLSQPCLTLSTLPLLTRPELNLYADKLHSQECLCRGMNFLNSGNLLCFCNLSQSHLCVKWLKHPKIDNVYVPLFQNSLGIQFTGRQGLFSHSHFLT